MKLSDSEKLAETFNAATRERQTGPLDALKALPSPGGSTIHGDGYTIEFPAKFQCPE